MKKDILSLKSIYQFLVINDYPIFCTGIITKNNHTGLTLTKFWQDNILVEFRSHKYGRQIWRTEGGRNRYISEICNRSERLGFYGAYAEEIFDVAKPETVLRQIRQFMSFLVERRFHYDAFIKKLPAYLELLSSQDESFSEGAGTFFMRALDLRHDFDEQGSIGQAFYCGLVAVTLQALSVAEKLTGVLEERVLQLLLLAVEIESIEHDPLKERLDFLTDLWARYKEIPEDTRMYLNMLLCCYGYQNIQELDMECSKQMENPEIFRKLNYTCAYVLGKRYGQIGELKRMGELADYLWESDADADTQIEACVLKSDLAALEKGDFNAYEEWLERGLEIGKRSGRKRAKRWKSLCVRSAVFISLCKNMIK